LQHLPSLQQGAFTAIAAVWLHWPWEHGALAATAAAQHLPSAQFALAATSHVFGQLPSLQHFVAVTAVNVSPGRGALAATAAVLLHLPSEQEAFAATDAVQHFDPAQFALAATSVVWEHFPSEHGALAATSVVFALQQGAFTATAAVLLHWPPAQGVLAATSVVLLHWPWLQEEAFAATAVVSLHFPAAHLEPALLQFASWEPVTTAPVTMPPRMRVDRRASRITGSLLGLEAVNAVVL
jgi:hypothetical protein